MHKFYQLKQLQMFFGKDMLLYNIFTNLVRGGHRNDVTDTRSDAKPNTK